MGLEKKRGVSARIFTVASILEIFHTQFEENKEEWGGESRQIEICAELFLGEIFYWVY